jgi:hypothetical protein
MVPDRRQDTQFVSKMSTVERNVQGLSNSLCDDNQNPTYGSQPGFRYDVDRYMPVPYDITFKLDCWTTNTTNKLQVFEQISTVFNPSIQLQQNSNLLDWTSIFEVWMEDFTWTNRSVPQGGEAERDVMSWKFKVQAWINPPAKVKRSSLIAEIVTNVFSDIDVGLAAATIDSNEYDVFRTCFEGIPMQIITTEGNYKISVTLNGTQNEIVLLNQYGQEDPLLNWQSLIQKYGQITPNITKIRLKLDPNIEVSDSDIIGSITQDPARQNVLFFVPDVDTMPASTIPPINDIIDPTEVTPGDGLPIAAVGQRYLLTSSDSAGEETAIPAGVTTSPWGPNIIAYPNDVIEFNGGSWKVIFDSKNSTGLNYVVNNSNGIQYTFDGKNWHYTYLGIYSPGYWRIDNIISAPNGTTVNQYD